MPTFELQICSTPEGFAAAWFDNESHLWDDERLRSPGSLVREWVAPRLKLYRPERGATSVLFNPNALAISQGLRDELATFSELEFLEVSIEGHGTFFIFHVTAAIEIPPQSNARVAPTPSRNVVEIRSFPESFAPPSGFFRILQPTGSAASRMNRTTRAIYLGQAGKNAIERLASPFLEVRQR